MGLLYSFLCITLFPHSSVFFFFVCFFFCSFLLLHALLSEGPHYSGRMTVWGPLREVKCYSEHTCLSQLSPYIQHTHASSLIYTCIILIYPNSTLFLQRWLRSADVRILRQLVAVHEGIEAMRWLMEERDALASRGSSLTGSLSSLVTVEEHGPSMSPCRESLSPTQGLTETAGEESEDHLPLTDHGDSNHNMLSPESTKTRPPSLSTSTFEGRHDQASSSPASGLVIANLLMSQPRDSDVAPLQDIKSGADTIRRALLRSNRARRAVKVDNDAEQSEGTRAETEVQTQETFRASQNNTMEKEESAPNIETNLLGYDTQWCWVESQDDVTFL
ncbi:uncharacterized protein LOC121615377 isoform X1 [Chelmon rostratus]|uniref:uncharacterized protein LOC121615377 isoform X1 n=1 Tax=Chelmon rostratus TaxID=109905 RepID=UPI001BEABADB|nr:uncharacterized protein LOC121615377 isoform X1 [Chelmon rostratus]XP_041805646.1 uncharacterized protein LOC121615377 isoform X1 [Chelmon rostratus]XP_041805647.1 uncharacterized protein LOC121615377 isoform X1 [Chelmon rostratus]